MAPLQLITAADDASWDQRFGFFFIFAPFRMQQNGVITVITYNYVSMTFNLKPVKERRAEKWRSPCQRSRSGLVNMAVCCFVGGLQARHGGGVTVGGVPQSY